jgi:hypothetical protein
MCGSLQQAAGLMLVILNTCKHNVTLLPMSKVNRTMSSTNLYVLLCPPVFINSRLEVLYICNSCNLVGPKLT